MVGLAITTAGVGDFAIEGEQIMQLAIEDDDVWVEGRNGGGMEQRWFEAIPSDFDAERAGWGKAQWGEWMMDNPDDRVIVDLSGGSGTKLRGFIRRWPAGTFMDLPYENPFL
jgi:hypothetical protein